MMNSELVGKIITGLITAVVTVVVCLINNWVTLYRDRKSREDLYSKQQNELKEYFTEKIKDVTSTQAEIKHEVSIFQVKLEDLTHKVEKHNNLVERMYCCEKRLDVAEERQKTANHRIDDCERIIEKTK